MNLGSKAAVEILESSGHEIGGLPSRIETEPPGTLRLNVSKNDFNVVCPDGVGM